MSPSNFKANGTPAAAKCNWSFVLAFIFPWRGSTKLPPLIVQTRLQTETAQGLRHHAQGKRIGADGEALLVGIATVPPTGDGWLDRFLGLPDEALALLQCRLTPVNSAF